MPNSILLSQLQKTFFFQPFLMYRPKFYYESDIYIRFGSHNWWIIDQRYLEKALEKYWNWNPSVSKEKKNMNDNFIKGLLVIRHQADEDANNKFSESKDRSSKPPRNISEKKMFGKNVRHLSKLVLGHFWILISEKSLKLYWQIHTFSKIYLTWDIQEYYLEHLKGGRDPHWLRFPNPEF